MHKLTRMYIIIHTYGKYMNFCWPFVAGTGYIQEASERRESDFDIGSRDFGENFSPPDTMNSDEENGKCV